MFEHHYDNMIKKNYSFTEINNLLKENNFKMIFKAKMPLRSNPHRPLSHLSFEAARLINSGQHNEWRKYVIGWN